MIVSVTSDFWHQVQKARKKAAGQPLPALAPLPEIRLADPGIWFVRFRMVGRRRYLIVLHPATGLFFAVSGIRDKDLAEPVALCSSWIENGLKAIGLSSDRVNAYREKQGGIMFCDGGDRKLVAKANALFKNLPIHESDHLRPARKALAIMSMYGCLYYGYSQVDGHYPHVLPQVLDTFLPGETIDIERNASKWHGFRALRFSDGRPALPVPGIEVTIEICRSGSRFGMPIAGVGSGTLPTVRRVLHVPLDSSLFQLNQAIQASLGLFAYHHYRFFPAAGPDAEWPFTEVYCWDYPPEEPFVFFDEYNGPEGVSVPLVSDLAISLRDVQAKTDFLYYVYDFGDDWTYAVHLGDPVELAGFYCELAEGQGDPPPVDVGGLSGWARFLAAVAKPKSKSGREMLEWSRIVLWEPFDFKAIQERLASLDYLDGEYWAKDS